MAISSTDKKAAAKPLNVKLPALPSRGTGLHAIANGMSREVRHDIYDLDPKRIVIDGYYVRVDDESDEDFKGFEEGIRLRGQIDVPISVRTTGPPTARRYILIWGRRRLRAALRVGLATVPVRDYGELEETEAVKLQLSENLNRREMTPVECATAFWELSQRGISNREIVALFSRAESYVSYMVKMGEALAQLRDDDRRRMNRDGLLYVRDCQAIAALSSLADRIQALQTLLKTRVANAPESTHHDDANTATAPKVGQGRVSSKPGRRADEQQAFIGRGLRNQGRSFRVRWVDGDLRADPDRFVSALTTFLDRELEQLVEHLDTLETEYRSAGIDAAQLDAVARARTAVVGRMAQHLGRRPTTSKKTP